MDIKPTEEFLLDLFAKDAMNALVSGAMTRITITSPEQNEELSTAVAEGAYKIAEAMIVERRKHLPEK